MIGKHQISSLQDNVFILIKRLPAAVAAVLGALLLLFLLGGGRAGAVELTVPLNMVGEITHDEQGLPLFYPSAVFFDPFLDEIYLVHGGRARILVYGPDFYPRYSLGQSRGVYSPKGGLVMGNGDVYICQAGTRTSPRPKVTVLNGAFFVDREIYLDEIPEAAGFQPSKIAVSKDGTIYLAASSKTRGVLVLSKEGKFLRWIQPMDQITLRGGEALKKIKEEQAEQGESEDDENLVQDEESLGEIPKEFRPRRSFAGPEAFWQGLGPVKIINVIIDDSGRLYLISNETSRIYVYGPDENFLFAFGVKGGSPHQLSYPKSLAVDEKREIIYVADYMRHTILIYNLAGEYIIEFGGRGYGTGWFNYPNDVVLDSHGNLIVADLFNRRVQVLEVGYEKIIPALIEMERLPESAIDKVPAEMRGPAETEQRRTLDQAAPTDTIELPDEKPVEGEIIEEEGFDEILIEEEELEPAAQDEILIERPGKAEGLEIIPEEESVEMPDGEPAGEEIIDEEGFESVIYEDRELSPLERDEIIIERLDNTTGVGTVPYDSIESPEEDLIEEETIDDESSDEEVIEEEVIEEER
jgi:ribosomal protein L24E